MSKKPSRKKRQQQAASQLAEMQERFFDTELVLDGYDPDDETAPSVRVKFDEETVRLSNMYAQGLRKARGVRRPESINAFDPHVKRMIELKQRGTALMESEEGVDDATDDPNTVQVVVEFADINALDATEAVKQAMSQFERHVREDSLKVAMLEPNFEIRRVKTSNGRSGAAIAFIDDLLDEGIPDEVWEGDDDEAAWQVVTSHSYPAPPPDRTNAAEVRVQLMYQLFQENPTLTLRINRLFEQAVNMIASVYYGDELEESAMDEIGFHSTAVGRDLDEPRRTRASRRRAKRSGAETGTPAAGSDDGPGGEA